MLQKLTIKNYAIIDHIEVSFSDHLNIITGETGAGKSIIIDALSLILGQRADVKTLFDKTRKCIVEAAFDIRSYGLEDFFRENDLDYEPSSIIRREINPAGKSRSFINDTPVNLSVLKELGAQLINLHSQHETLELTSNIFQLQLVDAVVQHNSALKEFQQEYAEFKKTGNSLKALLDTNNLSLADIDYLQFQLNELTECQLKEDEQETIEGELNSLENAEEIKINLSKAAQLLEESENSISTQLRELHSALRSVEQYHPAILQLNKRIESTQIELEDISGEINSLAQSVQHDPARIEEINERLNELYRLEKKHQVKTVRELMDIQNELSRKLESFEKLNVQIEELNKRLEAHQKKLEAIGEKLHSNRKKKTPDIEKRVQEMLAGVGMPNARFKVELEKLPFEKINPLGLDKARILFTANKGSAFEELKNVASGGELSRLMLVLKSLIASSTALPTLIFDEIDTGISGEVAIKVGKLLEQLGNSHQIISITHLPQIARIGKTHFHVHKELNNGVTVTRIKNLSEKERVVEIAKMIGGDKYSETALENARELLLN